MSGTVKGATKVGIDERVERLRLQLVATDLSRRVGLRIRQRRMELGLKQREVAKEMASSPDKQRISDWERGQQPGPRYLQELADALKVPDISYFYEDPEQPAVLDALAGTNGQPDDLAERLTRIEDKLDQLLRREPTDVPAEIHRGFEDLQNRLGRGIAKRPPRSRGAKDRPPEAPPAAA